MRWPIYAAIWVGAVVILLLGGVYTARIEVRLPRFDGQG